MLGDRLAEFASPKNNAESLMFTDTDRLVILVRGARSQKELDDQAARHSSSHKKRTYLGPRLNRSAGSRLGRQVCLITRWSGPVRHWSHLGANFAEFQPGRSAKRVHRARNDKANVDVKLFLGCPDLAPHTLLWLAFGTR